MTKSIICTCDKLLYVIQVVENSFGKITSASADIRAFGVASDWPHTCLCPKCFCLANHLFVGKIAILWKHIYVSRCYFKATQACNFFNFHYWLIHQYISLSTIVLNNRNWSEIVWLPKISRFINQPCNRLYPKKPTGIHWSGYNDAVSLLKEAKTRIFQPTANFEIFEIYLYFVCLPASQPACLPACLPASLP